MTSDSGVGLQRRRSVGWLLWIVLAAMWFTAVPSRPLLDPDEGRYAEIPREMVASGDWVTPRLDGLKYFEKPPLQYWATAAAYSLFGLSEWTARLWAVGLAFLCLPMAFAWTVRQYGPVAGLGALTALAMSPYFEIIGHLNLLDASFTFWLSAAVFAFTRSQCLPVGSRGERRWMLAAWAAAALAVLTKGIVVGVLAGGSLVLYSLIERDASPWRRLHARWGLPLFLLLAAPWFAAVSLRNPSFPQFFFVHEHFTRYLTTVHQRVEPWWYFPALLAIAAIPWLASLPAAVRRGWFDSNRSIQFKPLKFILIFCILTLVFFSMSRSKLAPYILPIMPPLAAVVGACAADRPHFLRRTLLAAGVLMLCVGLALIAYSVRRNGFLPSSTLPWLLLGTAAVVGMMVSTRSIPAAPRAAWVAVAGGILSWQCLMAAYAHVPPERSAYGMLLSVKPLIHPQTQLFSIGQYRETISPYLGRTLSLVEFQGELAFGLDAEPWKRLSADEFLARWGAATDAVVFLDPSRLEAWRQRGLQGRVIAGDQDTVAVSRL